MPKLKNGQELNNNPDSVFRASRNIRTIALKNMDNPAEEPTLKPVSTELSDKLAVEIEKFNVMMEEIDEVAGNVENITGVLIDKSGFVGAGMKMKGGAFSKNITSHAVPNGIGTIKHRKPRVLQTGESFKPRYGSKYSQYDYGKTGLNMVKNFVGAGRRRKMRGGADPNADFDLGLDEEDEEDEEDEDEEDEEDEEDDSHISVSLPSASAGDDLPDIPSGEGTTATSLLLQLKKLVGSIKRAERFFKSSVRPKLKDMTRPQKMSFIGDTISLLEEIGGTISLAMDYADDVKDIMYMDGNTKTGDNIGSTIREVQEAFKNDPEFVGTRNVKQPSGLYYTVDEAGKAFSDIAERSITKKGSGMLDYRGDYTGVNTREDLERIKRMNGGARGGVPILSSIASSYHRIPTKYML
jgi:hypothetical protein